MIVIGRSKLGEKIEKAAARARKTSERELNADAAQLDADLQAATKELARA